MKKIVFVVGMAVMVLTFGLALVGCSSSAPFVYDATVPPDQSSTLIIQDCQVYKFNGETMNLKNWNAGVGEKTVIIPAGNHTLEVWSSEASGGSNKLEYGKVEMTHNFLPGRTYLLQAPIKNGYVNGRIINVPSLTDGDLVPNIESPDATPFEGVWVNTSNKNQQWIFANNEFMIKQSGSGNRGIFTYKGNTVTVNMYFFYAFGKWKIARTITSYDLTYNGTTLDFYGNILKRAE